ncbi:MAG TPA: hypothetical protein VLG10_14405 [Methylomirabilota bacterium]|nr:hypothetical protein [Methylomirabilota bacterium]
MFAPRWAAAVCVCLGLLLFGGKALEAQQRIRLAGWVQWIGGTRMQVMTDGGTVAVDLQEADQGSYQGLRSGERIIVDGVVATDRSRVIAREIWRDSGDRSGFGFQAP